MILGAMVRPPWAQWYDPLRVCPQKKKNSPTFACLVEKAWNFSRLRKRWGLTSQHLIRPQGVSGVIWEVINGVGVDGVGGNFSPFFCRFSSLFRFPLLLFVFSVCLCFSPRTRANYCNLLGKWRISLQPRLHRPRSELPVL